MQEKSEKGERNKDKQEEDKVTKPRPLSKKEATPSPKETEKEDGDSEKDQIELTSSPLNSPQKEQGDRTVLRFQDCLVTMSGYETLAPGQWIDDSIVDFYTTYLKHMFAGDDNIRVLKTFFMSKLMMTQGDSTHKYFSARSWVKDMNLFENSVTVIPVCTTAHWFIILVVNLGNLVDKEKTEMNQKSDRAYLCVMDSSPEDRSQYVNAVKDFLMHEHVHNPNSKNITGDVAVTWDKVDVVYAEVPRQTNSTECGLHVLKSVGKLLDNYDCFLQLPTPRLTDWFTEDSVKEKRVDIANLIGFMAKEEDPDMRLPKLFSRAKRSASKKDKKQKMQAVKPVDLPGYNKKEDATEGVKVMLLDLVRSLYCY